MDMTEDDEKHNLGCANCFPLRGRLELQMQSIRQETRIMSLMAFIWFVFCIGSDKELPVCDKDSEVQINHSINSCFFCS